MKLGELRLFGTKPRKESKWLNKRNREPKVFWKLVPAALIVPRCASGLAFALASDRLLSSGLPRTTQSH